MNNEELKKKIVEVLKPVIRAGNISCNEENACKKCWFPCEIERTAGRLADALIAAKIGDVKDLQAQVDVLEITNIALQAGYDDAEKDRLYWVDKYKEAEHRAEVAEKAGRIIQRDMARVFDISNPRVCELIANIWDLAKKQAEKELSEEGKDD